MKLLFLLIFYPLDLTRDPVAYSTPSFWYGPWSTEPAEGPTLEERERWVCREVGQSGRGSRRRRAGEGYANVVDILGPP